VARGAKLPVLSGATDLVEQHFIDIALDILKELTLLLGFALNSRKMSSMMAMALAGGWHWV